CYTASRGLSMIDVTQCVTFKTRYLRLALRAGEPSRVALALALEAGHAGMMGGASRRRAEECLRRAGVLARRLNKPHVTARLVLMEAVAAWGVGKWAVGLERADCAEGLVSETRELFAGDLTLVRHFALDCLLMLGRWGEMAGRLPHYIRDARHRADRFTAS